MILYDLCRAIRGLLFTAIDWLEPAAYLLGLAIAIWAFYRCHKRGYILVGVYFALAVFTLLVMPSINRMIAQGRTPVISEVTAQKMGQAEQEAADRVLEEAGSPPICAVRNVNFPLGPILLVTGLWLIARREKSPEPSPSPNSSPATGSPSGEA